MSLAAWQILFLLLILVVLATPGMIGAYTDRNSGRRLRRGPFLLRVLAIAAGGGFMHLFEQVMAGHPNPPAAAFILYAALATVFLAAAVWYGRLASRRARDARLHPAFAYVVHIPFLGFPILLLLAAWKSRPEQPGAAVSATTG